MSEQERTEKLDMVNFFILNGNTGTKHTTN